jgi:hypothetical protein
MDDTTGYAVFLYPQALEALGDAIKPYLIEGAGGTHVLCREIDTGGAFIEMALDGLDAEGKVVKLELMIPSAMVRMIVSVRSDESFGFVPRLANVAMPTLPPAAPTAAPVEAPPATAVSVAATAEAQPTQPPTKAPTQMPPKP